MDKSLYPPDWDAISQRIRFERAGGCCEWCGVPHGALILRSREDAERYLRLDERTGYHYDADEQVVRLSGIPAEFSTSKYVRVVLTTAHLNHDTFDNRDENLAALCQLHHLRHDVKYHAQNARKTRQKRNEEARVLEGQLSLFAEEDFQ